MDLTPKQQTSEAIRQADNILVMTGQHPSVDQVTAVLALSAILRKFGKNATAVMSDNPPASVQMLDISPIERGFGGSRDFVLKLDVSKVELDKLRYEIIDSKLNIFLTPFKGNFAPSDVTFGQGEANIQYDLVVVLGVPTRSRIDRAYEQNMGAFETIPMVNLDFHRSNENYGAVNLIEPNASSLCEMLVALSESLQGGIIDGEIATALLMGIVASTDRFTAAHTSPKSLTVAAQMMAAGARQQAVIKALYRDGKGADNRNDRPGGGDGQSGRGQDRGSDRDNRGDRHERNQDRNADRSADRERGGDRQRERQGGERPAERVLAQQTPAQTNAPEQPQAQPEPTEATPSREQVVAEDADMPIIQPGHIELSEPETRSEERPQEANQFQNGRPQVMPVADFAAAAEMFKMQPAAREVAPDKDES